MERPIGPPSLFFMSADRRSRDIRPTFLRCSRCPRMHKPVVVGRPVDSRIMLVGQAPGDKEPSLGRPFAWTAGRTLFKWFAGALGWTEDEVRDRIYFAAVCRCFPGKRPEGRRPSALARGDRGLRALAGAGVRLLRTSLVIPGRQACHRAVPRAGAARRTGSAGVSGEVCRPRGGLHPAAASVRRLAVAPDGAGKDVAGAGARA